MYHVDREVLANTRAALKLETPEPVLASVQAPPPAEPIAPPRAAVPAEGAVLVDLHSPTGDSAPSGQLRFALWSDGTFEIVRRNKEGDDLMLVLPREEMRQLVAYLDSISLHDLVAGEGRWTSASG